LVVATFIAISVADAQTKKDLIQARPERNDNWLLERDQRLEAELEELIEALPTAISEMTALLIGEWREVGGVGSYLTTTVDIERSIDGSITGFVYGEQTDGSLPNPRATWSGARRPEEERRWAFSTDGTGVVGGDPSGFSNEFVWRVVAVELSLDNGPDFGSPFDALVLRMEFEDRDVRDISFALTEDLLLLLQAGANGSQRIFPDTEQFHFYHSDSVTLLRRLE